MLDNIRFNMYINKIYLHIFMHNYEIYLQTGGLGGGEVIHASKAECHVTFV